MMNTRSWIASFGLVLLAAGSAGAEQIDLWLDGEDTYLCDDPWVEEGISLKLTATAEEDCSGPGYCDWGWAEGVIYMHPARLVADLGVLAAVDSVHIDGWVTSENDLRAFLYHDGVVIDQDASEWYDGELVLHGGGQAVDSLAVSACDAELYEITLFGAEDTPVQSAPVPSGLLPAYPNPFNPSTTLSFVLARDERVRLSIHDVTGRRLRDLVADEPYAAGVHRLRWDGRDGQGRELSSGVYLLRLLTESARAGESLLLVK